MPTDVTAALVESLVGGETGTHISAVVVETLVAEDIPSTNVHAVLVETLVAEDPIVGEIAVHAVLVETLVAHLPAPVDVVVPETSYTAIARRRFGEDLVLPLPGQEVQPTVSGDWPTVDGRANLHAAMRRRLITTPTQVVHRPDYGGGLELSVGVPATPTERATLAARARQNALRDPRVEEAQVLASEDGSGRTVVQLNVRPAGEVEPETVTVVSEG